MLYLFRYSTCFVIFWCSLHDYAYLPVCFFDYLFYFFLSQSCFLLYVICHDRFYSFTSDSGCSMNFSSSPNETAVFLFNGKVAYEKKQVPSLDWRCTFTYLKNINKFFFICLTDIRVISKNRSSYYSVRNKSAHDCSQRKDMHLQKLFFKIVSHVFLKIIIKHSTFLVVL